MLLTVPDVFALLVDCHGIGHGFLPAAGFMLEFQLCTGHGSSRRGIHHDVAPLAIGDILGDDRDIADVII